MGASFCGISPTCIISSTVSCYLYWMAMSVRGLCITRGEDQLSLIDYNKWLWSVQLKLFCTGMIFIPFACAATHMILCARLFVETQPDSKYNLWQLQFWFPGNRGQWVFAHVGLDCVSSSPWQWETLCIKEWTPLVTSSLYFVKGVIAGLQVVFTPFFFCKALNTFDCVRCHN